MYLSQLKIVFVQIVKHIFETHAFHQDPYLKAGLIIPVGQFPLSFHLLSHPSPSSSPQRDRAATTFLDQFSLLFISVAVPLEAIFCPLFILEFQFSVLVFFQGKSSSVQCCTAVYHLVALHCSVSVAHC